MTTPSNDRLKELAEKHSRVTLPDSHLELRIIIQRALAELRDEMEKEHSKLKELYDASGRDLEVATEDAGDLRATLAAAEQWAEQTEKSYTSAAHIANGRGARIAQLEALLYRAGKVLESMGNCNCGSSRKEWVLHAGWCHYAKTQSFIAELSRLEQEGGK
jgi:hypothetical protein